MRRGGETGSSTILGQLPEVNSQKPWRPRIILHDPGSDHDLHILLFPSGRGLFQCFSQAGLTRHTLTRGVSTVLRNTRGEHHWMAGFRSVDARNEAVILADLPVRPWANERPALAGIVVIPDAFDAGFHVALEIVTRLGSELHGPVIRERTNENRRRVPEI